MGVHRLSDYQIHGFFLQDLIMLQNENALMIGLRTAF